MLTIVLLAVCSVLIGISVYSLWRVTSQSRRRLAPEGEEVVPITVLKPLCGADDALEANLETFFRQDYPQYELVFGVEGDQDPAIPVVRRLRERFPHVACRLVIHDGGRGLNPKVSNLRAMLDWADTADVVVISDSNIAVAPDYLSEMYGHMVDGDVGLVTSLFTGVGEQTLGATLEALHLNGSCAPMVASTQVLGDRTASIGKSMMFRRSVFGELGGFESVATLLAEDYVMGRMFQTAGHQVRLTSQPIGNVCQKTTVIAFLKRHLRWGLIRSRLNVLMYAFEPLVNPMAMALLGIALGAAPALALCWAVGVGMLRDTLAWLRLRGRSGLASALPLSPLKDLLALGVWAVAPFLRTVGWRNRKFRVGAGTRLYAEQPMVPPEKLRCEV